VLGEKPAAKPHFTAQNWL